jgi:hypothetical protein
VSVNEQQLHEKDRINWIQKISKSKNDINASTKIPVNPVNPVECDCMPEEWFVRVQGKEYGPVDLETLQEWKTEGRVLPTNEVRKVDVDPVAVAASAEEALWTTAAEIPGLFASESSVATAVAAAAPRSLHDILVQTWRIYLKGFWQFLVLNALVFVPSLCGQLTSATVPISPGAEIDLRASLAALFNLAMLLLTIAAWPVYVAGIQILTSELAAGRSIAIVDLVQRALTFWLRVIVLCILVYGAFFLLMVLALGILVMIIAGGSSIVIIFLALGLLVLQVWMFGRVFVNVMFWQQFTVLQDAAVMESLRESKDLARSRRDLPWFRRPLWRGAFLASLWIALVILLNIGPEWSLMQRYFQTLATTQDPQALLQSLNANPPGFDVVHVTLAVLQAVLRPLLGIAFVLLYFASIGRTNEDPPTEPS